MKHCVLILRVLTTYCLALFATASAVAQPPKPFLSTEKLAKYVTYFNAIDTETVKNYVPNAQALQWMEKEVPLFECPDTTLEKIYYYRWWTLRKHLKETPDGFVFTEFITPMNHGGKYNTISSALGHHIYEGRWLHDPRYIDDYINFWLRVDPGTPKPHLHAFSSWLQDAMYNRFLVRPDTGFIVGNLALLDQDYRQWETEKMLPDGKFWQFDVRDAMEESISGGRKEKNVRPTINSYMFGNATALTRIAALAGNDSLQSVYNSKAKSLRSVVENYLWDDSASFFKVRHENGHFSDAREAIGFIPWYFQLPADNKKYARQWRQLVDTSGFNAPWGLTTAERRHPLFRTHGSGHGCEWDGAVWPFATTQTLKGLSHLLTSYRNKGGMTPAIFYNALHTYAASHTKRGMPYLGEYQDEQNGEWLKGDNPRSSYYNHSCFADLVISDLVGLKPRADNKLELFPLVPAEKWDWFCLDQVMYHGKTITVAWDKTGTRYGRGKGLGVYADGKEIYRGKELKHVLINL